MPGCYLHVCLFLFAVGAKEILGVTVQTGLYSRVELRGEKFDQHTADSLQSVEWTKQNASSTCLCVQFIRLNRTSRLYSPCCGRAHLNLNNNSLILENVSAQVEGVFTETVFTETGAVKRQNFTLHILYSPNATGIVVFWTSNMSVSLRCEVTGSFIYLMWTRDSTILEDNRHSFSERNQTLHISNITSTDCGTYSCVATNAYGQSETQTCITNETCSVHCENFRYQEEHGPNVKSHITEILIRALTLTGALGLCNLVFYGLFKYQHRHLYVKQEDKRKYLALKRCFCHSNFIKPRQVNQNAAAAEPLKDYETGLAGREKTILYCRSSYEHARKE